MSKTYRHSRSHRHEKPYRRVRMSRHHLLPKSLGGGGTPDNILYLWRDRHDVFHKIFGNLTLEQCIAVLQRVARMKGRTSCESHTPKGYEVIE